MSAKINKFKNTSRAQTEESADTVDVVADILKDNRSVQILGLTFVLIALYLLVAFSSYIFTWQTDQDKIFKFSWSLLFTSDIFIENRLGRLGAIIAHTFFYNWFGLTSFLFVFLSLFAGLRLLLKRAILPLKIVLKYSFFTLFWLPTLMAFVFKNVGFPFGGGLGIGISNWLIAFIGNFGIATLLMFILLIFLITINVPVAKIFTMFRNNTKGNKEEPSISNNEVELENELILEKKMKESKEIDQETINVDIVATEQTPIIKADQETIPEDIGLDIEEPTIEEQEVDSKDVSENYDPTLDLSDYKYPTIDLLEDYGESKIEINKEELEANKNQIIQTLINYNIKISQIKATVGPTVTLYEIVPAPGVRISKIKNLEDDIALSLSALGIRIIAPIPGKGTIGIEVPNLNKEIVPMRTLLGSEKFQHAKMDLPIALGKTITNEIFITDLAKMPHLLMAGATGQGKSVGINAIISSLLYKKHPSQLKLVLVDPKKVELSLFKLVEKHFLAKLPEEEESIITDTQKVVATLNSLCIEMDERYNLLKEASVRNIKEYNEKFIKRRLNPEKGHRFLPFIVLIIDEFADLIMTAGKEVETPIARLAQLARAIGIHLVIATQRPSVNIITGTIKANFPARIAFKVTSKIDSRTILDAGGADQLIGRGDMLFALGSDIVRLQCPFIDTPEVEKVAEFIGDQRGYTDAFLLPEFKQEETGGGNMDTDEKDPLFDDAARVIVDAQQGSTSLLQRRMKLGYNRAGRIMDQLEAAGIVGPSQGSKAREVRITDPYQLEQFLQDGEA